MLTISRTSLFQWFKPHILTIFWTCAAIGVFSLATAEIAVADFPDDAQLLRQQSHHNQTTAPPAEPHFSSPSLTKMQAHLDANSQNTASIAASQQGSNTPNQEALLLVLLSALSANR